jgi:hypothetical protein
LPTNGSPADPAGRAARPRGTAGFYLVAAAATAVSVNTSYRFFADVLHISNLIERAGMFAVLEIALAACGYAMRHAVRRPPWTPGPARSLAWVLCGLSGYMAIVMSGPIEGLARVALGPALALVSLHLALGIEVHARRGERSGTMARIGRELRERLLSRLGLADDSRTALARTRDRAAERAARLAVAGRGTPWRRRRLARAVRASGAALDERQRDRMMALIAAHRHLGDLATLDYPSPWRPAGPDDTTNPASSVTEAAGHPSLEPAPQAALALAAVPPPAPRPTHPARRRAAATKRQPSAAERVTRAMARSPQATAAQIAARLGLSERTVQRHMRAAA